MYKYISFRSPVKNSKDKDSFELVIHYEFSGATIIHFENGVLEHSRYISPILGDDNYGQNTHSSSECEKF